MASISTASGRMPQCHLGCAPADSVVAVDISICLAASELSLSSEGFVRGRDEHILRVGMLDVLALCTCCVATGAKLVWKGAGSGARPVWVAQLAPPALTPYGCPFTLLCCKFSWNMSIPWYTVKFLFPLQNLLRSSAEMRE